MKKLRLTKLKIDEISAVDSPAQAPALAAILKRSTIEKIEPKKGESEQDYVSRFMGSAAMIAEFPDAAQRAAVAHSKFKQGHVSKAFPEDATVSDLTKGSNPTDNQAADGGTLEMSMTPEEKAAIEKAAAEQKTALETLTKRAERAERLAQLNDAQRALFVKMDTKAQDEFLALSPEARQAEVSKASDSDPIVYTSLKGRQFRKSADPVLVELAKENDENQKARIESERLVKRERLEKRATGLTNLPGDLEAKILLLEAVETIPVEKRAAVEAMLKAQDAGLAEAFRKRGVSGENDAGDSPDAKLETIAKALRVKDPTLTEAQALVKAMETKEGLALYRQHIGVGA